MDSDALVQPIVVDKAGTHLATIRAAAVASVLCWYAGRLDEVWAVWLSGPFTKTVRRAKTAQVLALAQMPGSVTVGRPGDPGFAVALPPVRYTDLPREIVRLQVSGTDLPRDPALAGDDDCPVALLLRDDLTTGKAAAQAAHALMAWALPKADGMGGEVDALVEHAGPPVSLVDPELLEKAARRPGTVAIRDNGLTEVEPDTLTAVALTRT
ncbi:MAG: hypothetical protein FWH11_12415 [Micrococcales bacterium]|nr:hypothetical protein [Micrococcales bacterium]